MTQPKVFDLFPTPLYVNQYDGDTTDIINYFEQQEMHAANGPYGVISKNNYVLDGIPKEHPFVQWLKDCFRQYATELMRYDYEDIEFSQSWLTYKEPGQFHKAHTHPNSLLAGVFYYDHEPGDASIVFSRENKSFNRPYLEPKLLQDHQEHKYSQEEIYFTPEKNTFIIFPSWMMHGVPPNNTNKIRKALGVNVMTKGVFGDSQTISEIDYARFTK